MTAYNTAAITAYTSVATTSAEAFSLNLPHAHEKASPMLTWTCCGAGAYPPGGG
jgi:hypothetical protein